MKEYHKIETPFVRDVGGTKKLISGLYRNPAVEFLRYCPWEWTEKIDGTNIRVHWDGHAVTLAGRTDRANIPRELFDKLKTLFCSTAAEEMFEQLFGLKEVTLYGEGYGRKIQNGGAYIPDGVDFILFDVEVGDMFLERPNVANIATAFGISVVPLIMTGTVAEAISYVKGHPKSTIGTAYMEGLVGRPAVTLLDRAGNRIILKVKYCDFKEEPTNA